MYEIGGIESVDALPDDPTFNQKTNKCKIASYKNVCGEFGIDPSSDFRFTHGKNTGLATSHMRGLGLQITTIQTLTLISSMMNA